MMGCDVINEFLNHNRLAHSGTTEPDQLATTSIWCEQINHLNPGIKGSTLTDCLLKSWGFAMNGIVGCSFHRTYFVHRIPNHIDNTSQGLFADGNHDVILGVHHFHATDKTITCIHGNRANGIFPYMLGNLKSEIPFAGINCGIVTLSAV